MKVRDATGPKLGAFAAGLLLTAGAMLDKAAATVVLIAAVALLAGCSAPNPNTPAGAAEIAGQKCTLCRAENPGDISPCYAICMQRIQDQGVIGR
jgi:hypothetical protein